MTALVDTAGAVVERYLYDPYGKVTFIKADWSLQDSDEQHLAGTISAVSNELLFTGHRLDLESGHTKKTHTKKMLAAPRRLRHDRFSPDHRMGGRLPHGREGVKQCPTCSAS
jgi:hypothetical protein